ENTMCREAIGWTGRPKAERLGKARITQSIRQIARLRRASPYRRKLVGDFRGRRGHRPSKLIGVLPMNIPRQPFVGLGMVAALGIAVADFVPIAPSQWLIWLIALVSIAIVLFWKSNTGLTYLLVGYAFFLLHNFQTGDTPGLRLANELGERMRTVRATGV